MPGNHKNLRYVECVVVTPGLLESSVSALQHSTTSQRYTDEQQTQGLLLDLEEIKKEYITDVEISVGSGSTLIEDHKHCTSLEDQIKQV